MNLPLGPMLLIAAGVLFLFVNFGPVHGELLPWWPVLLIVGGVAWMACRRCRNCPFVCCGTSSKDVENA